MTGLGRLPVLRHASTWAAVHTSAQGRPHDALGRGVVPQHDAGPADQGDARDGDGGVDEYVNPAELDISRFCQDIAAHRRIRSDVGWMGRTAPTSSIPRVAPEASRL
jgi:hypothetical protein